MASVYEGKKGESHKDLSHFYLCLMKSFPKLSSRNNLLLFGSFRKTVHPAKLGYFFSRGAGFIKAGKAFRKIIGFLFQEKKTVGICLINHYRPCIKQVVGLRGAPVQSDKPVGWVGIYGKTVLKQSSSVFGTNRNDIFLIKFHEVRAVHGSAHPFEDCISFAHDRVFLLLPRLIFVIFNSIIGYFYFPLPFQMLTFYEYIQSKNRIRRLEEPRSQKEKPATFFRDFCGKGGI